MTGKHNIKVNNNKFTYTLTINRNITIIKGDSATGKSTLLQLIDDYYRTKGRGDVQIMSDVPLYVLNDPNMWKSNLSEIRGSIVFIDEELADVYKSKDFASFIKNTDNYYVIITRENLYMLPYGIDEIYYMKESGKYFDAKHVYNELHRVYSRNRFSGKITPSKIVIEDSNSGYQFFVHAFPNGSERCVSAGGNANVTGTVMDNSSDMTLAIVDSAAFGAYMSEFDEYTGKNEQIALYAPESFEYIILSSGIVKIKDLHRIINDTYNYVESSRFFSWENFFTFVITEATKNTPLQYNKSKLNPYYISGKAFQDIISTMHIIDFS